MPQSLTTYGLPLKLVSKQHATLDLVGLGKTRTNFGAARPLLEIGLTLKSIQYNQDNNFTHTAYCSTALLSIEYYRVYQELCLNSCKSHFWPFMAIKATFFEVVNRSLERNWLKPKIKSPCPVKLSQIRETRGIGSKIRRDTFQNLLYCNDTWQHTFHE